MLQIKNNLHDEISVCRYIAVCLLGIRIPINNNKNILFASCQMYLKLFNVSEYYHNYLK